MCDVAPLPNVTVPPWVYVRILSPSTKIHLPLQSIENILREAAFLLRVTKVARYIWFVILVM